MDKTPREIVFEIAHRLGFSDAALEECEEMSNAVIAHARPQIEAEARAAAVEEASKVFYELTDADADPNWPGLNEIRKRLQDLCYLPPTHAVVPIRFIEWVSRQESMPDHACYECVPNSEILEQGFRCAVHHARHLLAARPK